MRTHEQSTAELPPPRTPRGEWRASHDPDAASGAPGEDAAAGGAELDRASATFAALRPRLFGIAYRMLGSVADAEDVMQDAWIRWQGYDRARVQDPAAFLATTVTRLAINELNSARVRREAYVGPWLPEPIDTGDNPELVAERDESLEFAVLLLLERLPATERAAYVLREAFAYPYDRIAEIVQTSEANARQLVSRARKHIAEGRHAPVGADDQHRLLDAFLGAAQAGDLASLETLFTDDIVSYSDGGGVVHAARIPLIGRERVLKFVTAVSEWFWDGIEVRRLEANGQPAVLFSAHGDPFAVFAVDATVDGIDRLFWMMNPAKLGAALPIPS